ncbi:DUF1707 domain-containing protein [Streptomyces sp. SID14478]|uniref:DUF1707 SHOCT-like domain-containing protein n=1 Tax=Streptomyces sp. SID14478 TaxID=2706073 RepID=UPI0013DB94C5|nr:DUF1707 domain-containing protein [Streptomyces sp. SID14478]NEB76973.1 DUF1707 domain-containing protein [Streptomyces sp. SID14478]
MSNEPPGLRASHEDRDRVVDVLRIAAGDGRLSAEELDARLETALSARTLDELAGLTADLPGSLPVPGTSKDVLVIEQHGSKYVRSGRWSVPPRIEVRMQLGRATLDFTDAVLTSGVLRIETELVHSKLFLVTAPDIVIDTDGLGLTYSRVKLRTKKSDGPPRLRIELVGTLLHSRIKERR